MFALISITMGIIFSQNPHLAAEIFKQRYLSTDRDINTKPPPEDPKICKKYQRNRSYKLIIPDVCLELPTQKNLESWGLVLRGQGSCMYYHVLNEYLKIY